MLIRNLIPWYVSVTIHIVDALLELSNAVLIKQLVI
jgi:hypothetical protein